MGQLWETLVGYRVVGVISRFPSGRSQSPEVAFETVRFMRGRAGLVAVSSWQLSDSRIRKKTQRAVTYSIMTSSDSCKEAPKAQDNNGISLQFFACLFACFKSCYN